MTIELKNLSINKQKKGWSTTPREIVNIHNFKKNTKLKTITFCTKLPKNFAFLTTIIINGIVAFDQKIGNYKRTSIIGGGGRFEVKRRFFDGEVVEVELLFKDLIYFTNKKPKIEIIYGVKIEDEKGEIK